MGRNFIWLFGENLAATSNNNSYYFWKQVVRRRDGIDKYIVLEKNAANKETYASLSDKEKSFVVWKNTVKHFKIYLKCRYVLCFFELQGYYSYKARLF